MVVAVRNGVPVYLRDVARAELGYDDPGFRIFHKDQPVLALNAIPQSGANVMDAMAGLKRMITALQTDLLGPRGLELVQAYDQTDYIESSIGLVRESLVVGGLLSITILLLFLRSASSTLVIGVSIPVSLIGTFLVMWIFGRTINVVSLAGMAFAVGMVVDNSIVVLEEHLPAPPDGEGAPHRGRRGKHRGVGRRPRLHPDDHGRVRSGRVHQGGGRAAVRQHRHRDLGWPEPAGLDHRHPVAVGQDPAGRGSGRRRAIRLPRPVGRGEARGGGAARHRRRRALDHRHQTPGGWLLPSRSPVCPSVCPGG